MNPLAQAQERAESAPARLSSVAAAALTQPVRAADEQFGVQLDLARPVVVKKTGSSIANIAMKSTLGSLYATTAVVQMLDGHSTLKSLGNGSGYELNPMMSALVKNRTAFLATKVGIAAATIYATSHMARKNKLKAIVTLAAVNSAYAMILKHNYAIAGR